MPILSDPPLRHLLVAMVVVGRARLGLFGLVERLFYLCMTARLALVALVLVSV